MANAEPKLQPKPQPKPARTLLLVAGVAAALTLSGLGLGLLLQEKPGAPAPVAIGGPFVLESGDGQKVSDADLRGAPFLVFFGYTHCPDVCPTTLNAVAAALDKLGPKAKDLAPIFITVDPQRDTPAVMKQYTAAFTPDLVGLTGTPDEIARVAKEYRV